MSIEMSKKIRPVSLWGKLAAAGLLTAALVGCGGGSDGATGATGPAGAAGAAGAPGKDATAKVVISSNATPATDASAAAWAALAPKVTVNSVTVTGAPVVKFTVTDANGLPVIGLGNKSQSATATVAGLTNMAFTLAKLVPGTNGDPSKWVSYLVTAAPTVAQKAGTIATTASCNSATAPTWCGTFPTTDAQGTLVDNGDGSYQYTFYRDVTKAKDIVATLIDSADGLAKKADLGDLTFDATLTHRLGIQIGGSAPGTSSNNPTANSAGAPAAVAMVNTANAVYDFRPDGAAVTNTRDIVKIDSCSACHDGKVLAHGSRKDPRYCMTCHTDQIRYTFSQELTSTNGGLTLTGTTRPTTAVMDGRAIGNYPNMIHKTHMGKELVKQGYFFNAAAEGQYNEVGFPQSPANCTKCHDGSATAVNKTTNGDNWKNVPSLLACGACHDGINFATGKGVTLGDRDKDVAAGKAVGTTQTGHIGGAKANNAQCALCHDATTIPLYHAQTTATPNNKIVQDGVSSISYGISAASVNSAGNVVVTFSITKDGAPVTSLAAATTVVNAATGAVVANPAFQPIPGFVGGPSIYIAASVPQDGIATPADTNISTSVTLTNLLIASGSPKAGSIVADGKGNFTATITGDTLGQPVTATCKQNTGTSAITGNCVNPSPIVLPANTSVVMASVRGHFTQVNLPAYPFTAQNVLVSPNVAAVGGLGVGGVMVQKAATGKVARRLVVDSAKCNNCHDRLGTSPNFHGGTTASPSVGDSSEAQACFTCHTPNRTSSGWSVDASTFIHGIHGASKRTVAFTWHAGSTTDNYSKLGYPGVLKDCNQCHLPNTVNFGANAAAVPNMLWSAVATGKYNGATDTAGAISPYVVKDNVMNYGNGYSFVPAGAVVPAQTKSDGTVVAQHVAAAGGEIVAGDPANLVNSPISSACSACHDAPTAKAHMAANGGSTYEARATATKKVESCLICHGQGKEFDAAAVHQ